MSLHSTAHIEDPTNGNGPTFEGQRPTVRPPSAWSKLGRQILFERPRPDARGELTQSVR